MSEHYQLIRTDPNYRLAIQLEEMRAEMQPSLNQDREVEPVEHQVVYHHIHSNLSEKQAHLIVNNTNQILAIKKILNSLIVGRKPKVNRYTKYL